jgi:hypothetical protein
MIGFMNTLYFYDREYERYYRTMIKCIKEDCVFQEYVKEDDQSSGTLSPPDDFMLDSQPSRMDYIDRIVPTAVLEGQIASVSRAWLLFALFDRKTIMDACYRALLPLEESRALATVTLIASQAINRFECPVANIAQAINTATAFVAPPIFTPQHAEYMRAVGADIMRVANINREWCGEWMETMATVAWSLRELARLIAGADGRRPRNYVEQIVNIVTSRYPTRLQLSVTHAVLAAYVGYVSSGVYGEPVEPIVDIVALLVYDTLHASTV